MIAKQLLEPWNVERVRKGYVEYGDLQEGPMAGTASCRCCGEAIRRGEHSLRFAWDFNGNGSWTAQICFMHPACEPAPAPLRNAINNAAYIRTVRRRLAKLEYQWDGGTSRAQQQMEREIKRLREVLAKEDGR